MKKYLFLLTAAAILSGCEHPEKLCAVYQGTLPAADAPGIKTTITFKPDMQFEQKSVYIDKKDGTFLDRGTYSLNGSLIETRTPNGESAYYRLEDNRIRRLDTDKKEISGELASHYILKKPGNCPQ